MRDHKRGIGLLFAIEGLKTVFKQEKNFRIHLLVLFIVILLGFLFSLNVLEWSLIIIVSCMVLLTETINTALETMMDYLSPHKHPKVKNIKDMAAGAVLLSVICSVIVGCFMFIPKIIHLFN